MESGVRDSDQATPNDPGTLQAGGGGLMSRWKRRILILLVDIRDSLWRLEGKKE